MQAFFDKIFVGQNFGHLCPTLFDIVLSDKVVPILVLEITSPLNLNWC